MTTTLGTMTRAGGARRLLLVSMTLGLWLAAALCALGQICPADFIAPVSFSTRTHSAATKW